MITALYIVLGIAVAPFALILALAWSMLLLKLLFFVLAILAWPWLFVGLVVYDRYLVWRDKNET